MTLLTPTDRIQHLIEKSELNASKIFTELELSTNALSEWKKRKAKPSAEAIIKLANYFNVSTDYLLTGIAKQSDLLPDELILLNLYHQIPDDEKNECIGFIKGYIAHGKKQ